MRNLLANLWRFVRGWWAGFVLLAFFAWTNFLTRDLNDKFRQEHRYTVGTVYDTHWTLKAGQFADARFFVGGEKYIVDADADQQAGRVLVGRRFLVKYYPPDPQHYNVLYLDAPVPDYITDVPAEGWSVPPFTVPDRALAPAE